MNYQIKTIKSYTKYDYLDNKKVYTKLKDIIEHYYANTTKELFCSDVNIDTKEYSFIALYNKVFNENYAVFSISNTVLLTDIIPYLNMNFHVVFLSVKEYRQFKKELEAYL